MPTVKEKEYKELLNAGVHFGHLTRKWHPAMAPYIFMERNGIHIIDLNKTVRKLDEAAAALKQIAKSGKKILFVATKKQAKEIVSERVKTINMPYVTERWPGGMLTNFATIRRSVRKMAAIDKMETDGTMNTLSKRERLSISRQREKLDRYFGSIADLSRLPAAIFVVDIKKEHIAIAEAKKLNIPTFAIVDTNSDPSMVDFPIPANDDATKSIALIIDKITLAITEGLTERKSEKDKEKSAPKKEEKSATTETEEVKGEKAVAKGKVKKAEKVATTKEEKPGEEEKKSATKASADEDKPKAEKSEAKNLASKKAESK